MSTPYIGYDADASYKPPDTLETFTVRAPFNGVCTLFDGPGTATPGFPRVVDMPCRLISDPLFIDVAPPLNNSITYFTCDASQPVGPTTVDQGGGDWLYRYAMADRVQFASLPGVTWVVVRVESCTGPEQPAYWRSTLSLVEIPPPSPCQATYANAYTLHDDNDGLDHYVTRTSVTTWEGEGYLLTAEVEWVNPDICLSKWTIVKDGQEWINVNWDGILNGAFYDYVGPLAAIWANPTP